MIAPRITAVAAALIFVITAAPNADAQPKRKQARKEARKEAREGKRAKGHEKVRQRIRAARQWKLTEALELDEAQANKVFPILDSYDDKFLATMREGRRLRRELRLEVESRSPDKPKVNGLIDQMLDQQRQVWKLNEQRFQAVRKVLTPAQAAKALVLLPEIDRFIRREIGKKFQGRRGRRGGGGPGGFVDPF